MNIKLTQEAGRLGLASLPAPSAVGSCKLGHNSTICKLVHCLGFELQTIGAPQNLLMGVFMS